MAVDTLGLLWAVVVTPASTQDRDGGVTLLTRLRRAVKRLKVVWGDSAFEAPLGWAWVKYFWCYVVTRKAPGQKGFVPQPKRWIVERTFGWLNRSRRLAKDYERTTASSEAFVKVAMIQLMIRRLKPVEP